MQSYFQDGILPVFTMLFWALLTTLPRLQIICLGLEEEKQHLGKVRKINWAPQQAKANLTIILLCIFLEALTLLCPRSRSLSHPPEFLLPFL